MCLSQRISVPYSFGRLYNCTFCKAIKLEKLQSDIKDLCQRKKLSVITMSANIKSIIYNLLLDGTAQ